MSKDELSPGLLTGESQHGILSWITELAVLHFRARVCSRPRLSGTYAKSVPPRSPHRRDFYSPYASAPCGEQENPTWPVEPLRDTFASSTTTSHSIKKKQALETLARSVRGTPTDRAGLSRCCCILIKLDAEVEKGLLSEKAVQARGALVSRTVCVCVYTASVIRSQRRGEQCGTDCACVPGSERGPGANARAEVLSTSVFCDELNITC